MIEIIGDILNQRADALCITSNGFIKKNGALVMGAGIAKVFRDLYPGLDKEAGFLVSKNGNHVNLMKQKHNDAALILFPTKPDLGSRNKPGWMCSSSLELIERSAQELVELADSKNWSKIVLPKPGCGNGKLEWNEVKRLIKPILDNRFQIISLS